MSFEFIAAKFEPSDDYQASEQDIADVCKLRGKYPELEAWSDLALVVAFGDYSAHIMAVHWADWLCDQRHEEFLAYLYVRTICPSFQFDFTGLHMDDIDVYAASKPWILQAAAPAWTLTRE